MALKDQYAIAVSLIILIINFPDDPDDEPSELGKRRFCI